MPCWRMGKIGDKRALAKLVSALQRSGTQELQPTVAAAICLLGINCSSHLGYLQKMLTFADDNPGYQELVRAAAFGLDAIAIKGSAEALQHVVRRRAFRAGDPLRAPLALAVAKVALRNTPLMLQVLQPQKDQRQARSSCSPKAFDMLEEDLEEEQFFVDRASRLLGCRRGGSPHCERLAEQIRSRKLDFCRPHGLQGFRRRYRRRERDRAPHQVARAIDVHARRAVGDRSFGGLFRIDTAGWKEPILVSSADGVGTKLKVAFMTNQHRTIGVDLVNHCVNDILVQGARPLFFLDYLATGRLLPDVAEQVVEGLARGVPRQRLRAARRRDRGDARLLRRRRIRSRRVHRRRGRRRAC